MFPISSWAMGGRQVFVALPLSHLALWRSGGHGWGHLRSGASRGTAAVGMSLDHAGPCWAMLDPMSLFGIAMEGLMLRMGVVVYLQDLIASYNFIISIYIYIYIYIYTYYVYTNIPGKPFKDNIFCPYVFFFNMAMSGCNPSTYRSLYSFPEIMD